MGIVKPKRIYYIVNEETGCWEWKLSTFNNGYGQKRHGGKTMLAHRYMYELHRVPIPGGLCLDHLCRNKICVNPKHLEAVTMKENAMRGVGPASINAKKTHCAKGHPYRGRNLRIDSCTGQRICRICRNRIKRNNYHKNKVPVEWA